MDKNWYTSKTIWLGVLMILAAICEYIAGLPANTTLIQGISGIMTIIVRTITNTAVKFTPGARAPKK